MVWHKWVELVHLALVELRAVAKLMVNYVLGPSSEERIIKEVFQKGTFQHPDSILQVMDEFGWNQQFMMNVGDVKGSILDTTVLQVLQQAPFDSDKGHIFIEMGGYCGYSAVRIARHFGDKKAMLYSIEMNPLFAAIATKIVEYAGLADKVKIIVGTVDTKLEWTRKQFGFDKVDMIFVDHWKDRYLEDVQLAEKMNLLRNGTVILADNVIFPGTPEYLRYVRNHAHFSSQFFASKLEYSKSIQDGMELSTYTKK